ncbi:DsrE family protein [Thorsellia kenyensis]|uniref:DsrE family protein n=1 Tax=Thorsellia kenyensis TaxID=1549888 RepID=A0ABV6CD26_9GAMM
MKIVFHSAELTRENIVFKNIKNLIKEIQNTEDKCHPGFNDNVKICVVFNSDAVKTLVQNSEKKVNTDWEALPKNVELLACQNSLNGMNLQSNQLIKRACVISSGVYQLALLQAQGFHYIRP